MPGMNILMRGARSGGNDAEGSMNGYFLFESGKSIKAAKGDGWAPVFYLLRTCHR